MKCPKCGYLGFETSDRCRNCGYDFSLALDVSPGGDLPLNSRHGAGEPLADFNLSEVEMPVAHDDVAAPLDLDRLIGAEPAAETKPHPAPKAPEARRARSAPGARGASSDGLPLFTATDDDTPLITTPRPPRPPLAVRRTTPEVPRTRSRATTPRPGDVELAFLPDAAAEDGAANLAPAARGAIETRRAILPAPAGRRLGAALVDVALLGAINVAVLYLTLALAGLGVDQWDVLPRIPVVAFLALLDGGYLVVFIAASGQTVGKMLTGVRVIADDGRRVNVPGAVLRALGCGASLLTAGLGYLPAFVMTDGRALQDRLSGTRVVSAQ